MKVYVSKEIGNVLRERSVWDFVMGRLIRMNTPQTYDKNTEYVLAIVEDSVHIFLVKIGKIPKLYVGSMFSQLAKGSIQIGFVDLSDTNIENSILELIKTYWQLLASKAQEELFINKLPVMSI